MMPSLVRFAVLLHALVPALAVAATLRAEVRDETGAPVEDAVVLAVPADPALARKPTRPLRDAIEQVDEEFVPHVKAVLVGTAVSFPNHDPVRHHVYSFSPAKRFELPLYAGTPVEPVVFDRPGVVILGCNIHDWMIGYVYVSETPYFAKTGKDGIAALENLPAGRYAVRVWHERLAIGEARTAREASLGKGASPVAFVVPLKPARPVRRVPMHMHGSHY